MAVAPTRPGWTGPVPVSTFVATVADMRALPVLDKHQGVPDGYIAGVLALRCPWQLLPFVQAPVPNLIEPSRDPLRMWYRLAPGFAAVSNPWLDQVDWWIDPLNGNDGAQGDAASRALASPFEWSRRFQGARFSQGYHVRILGPIPALSLELDLAELGHLNFDVGPAANAQASAHVAGYVPPDGMTEYGVLTLVEALDLTPHLHRRIRFETGPATDALCWIAEVNPLGGGLNTARVTQPTSADPDSPLSPSVTSAHPLPVPGDRLVIETLAAVDNYNVDFVQGVGEDFLNSVVLSNASIGATTVGLTAVQCTSPGSLPGYIWASDVRAQSLQNNVVVMGSSLNADGIGVYVIGRDKFATAALRDCLIWDSVLSANAQLTDCLIQGGQLFLDTGGTWLAGDVAIFASPDDPISTLAVGATVQSFGPVYGAGNLGHGVNLADPDATWAYQAVKPTITGAAGDVRIHGVNMAWAGIPFFDGVSGSGIVDVVI